MLRNVDVKQLSNEELAGECAKRPVNEDAWHEFWQRFYPLVFRKVHNLMRPFGDQLSPPEFEDVIQLVFLNIFTRLPGYDRQKSPVTAYLSLVATSTVVDQLRRGKRKRTAALEEAEELADKVYRGEIEADELWQLVVKVLGQLGPRDRAILQELWEGADRADICKRYGITPTNLYSITYRFRGKLREALEKRANLLSELPGQPRT